PMAAARRLLASSHAMVISSLSEGGANVVSEAAVAGVPILASRIDGNVGLLGAHYPGYFPVGDTKALARLLLKVERDPSFTERLAKALRPRAALFRPARELAAWRRLLSDLAGATRPRLGQAGKDGPDRPTRPAASHDGLRSASPAGGWRRR